MNIAVKKPRSANMVFEIRAPRLCWAAIIPGFAKKQKKKQSKFLSCRADLEPRLVFAGCAAVVAAIRLRINLFRLKLTCNVPQRLEREKLERKKPSRYAVKHRFTFLTCSPTLYEKVQRAVFVCHWVEDGAAVVWLRRFSRFPRSLLLSS